MSMSRTIHRDQSGQSLIQVLISVAVMGITAAAFSTMMVNQSRELSALSQKLASTDLQQILTSSLADGSVCQYILNTPSQLSFDSTLVSPSTPQILTPTLPIYASVNLGPPTVVGPVIAQVGQPASANSNSAVIQSIALSISGIPSPSPPGPGAKFTGNWIVTFNPAFLSRPLRPISIATILTVDTSNPTAAFVSGCQGGRAGNVIQITNTGTWTLNANTYYYANATAVCPAGYKVIAGGAGCEISNGLTALIYSNPVGSDTWYGSCFSWSWTGPVPTSASGFGIRTHAVCMSP